MSYSVATPLTVSVGYVHYVTFPFETQAIEQDDTPNGVAHAPAWLSVVYRTYIVLTIDILLRIHTVNNVEYGRSVALTKQAARNEAARQALKNLGWNV